MGSACAAPPAARRVGRSSWHPPFYCEAIEHLRIDRQGDATPLPEGLEVTTGPAEAGDFAAFKLYVQSSDPRLFAEVTDGFPYEAIRARARTAPGSAEVPGRFYYSAQGRNPLVFFGPRNVTREDRMVILDFTFECGYHREWTATYLLMVRGTHGKTRLRQAVPAAQPPAPTEAPARSTPAPDSEAPECVDLAVSVEAGQAEVSQGGPDEFTIRVTNLGTEPAVKPEIRLSLPVGLWAQRWTTSQGAVGYDGIHRRWAYSPGTLAAGSTAEARVTGTALFGGELKLSAQPVTPDCNPENDQGEARANVIVPPRPDLAATWEKVDIGWTRQGFPLHRLLTGTLQVTNVGQAAAGPTRAVILDTWTGSGRIHNARALGWVEVPSLPAGAGAVVPVSLPYDAPQSHVWVVALLDSESSEYESNERNNLIGDPGWW